MKIALVDISGVGGIAHYVFSLAKALKKLNLEFLLITPQKTDFDIERESIPVKRKVITHYKFRNPLLKALFYIVSRIRLVLYLLKLKPDVAHFHEIKLPYVDICIVKILRATGIKVVFTLHNLKLMDFNISEKSFSNLYKTSDGLIVHSKENKESLLQDYKIGSEQRVAVIPHGEYSNLYNYCGDKNNAREKFGIDKDKNVLLFFGYIRKYKGLDILLEALNIVLKENKNFVLIVAGLPKEDMTEYYEYVTSTNIKDNVLFYPRYITMEELPYYFTAADCTILPYREIFQSGIVYLSYAYSKPVIATRVGGIPEIVEERKTGVLVNPEDPKAIADTIMDLFDNKEKLAKMGIYAQKYVKEKFSWEKIAEKTVQFYKEITDR